MEERIDVMTDYQMKTLMNMIITISNKVTNLDEMRAELVAIRDGDIKAQNDKKKDEQE